MRWKKNREHLGKCHFRKNWLTFNLSINNYFDEGGTSKYEYAKKLQIHINFLLDRARKFHIHQGEFLSLGNMKVFFQLLSLGSHLS